ncbi:MULTISPECIES: rhodanese-like domain-containing protein [unclassified Arsukibacterium]|uniref:rhodanese-like domain-containing protein n=1 Tax=unclassified Arsukibacterium TaxID=2635278 RepID=UPI000C3D10F3|nr:MULTISPECIES: rhodanese-like domain-containing protein [unclassified Arsukibacterium]MAA93269.1 rhodanese-like domain-containing protein [Rheinheimera sp.]MBM34239.1 rhodanese-like domain-containing protein [Rheinheimera sp.]HAW92238.1 rhodanese-like domain-containing protein [Candidatus Azambacteria bacterium]|tara:strand:- start:126 stop:560 length:435 start_codon:yes stop_codon:yes gene_type:complete
MAQFIEFVTNHPLLSLAWVVIFLIIVGGWIKARFSAIRQVSPTELTMLVNRQDGIVVDIRGEDEFKKGHITGARNITASQISEQKLPGLEKQKDAPIIVVCQAGMTAPKSAAALSKQGFTNVSVLQGGMGAWSSASLPVVKLKR